MAGEKRLVEQITPMDTDFAKWYTDVVKKAELIDYSSVKGCIILRPYAYAIWENIQRILDGMFKACGHENVYMPLFIPESLLQKEKDHVEGFAPEVAWVTHGGSEKLQERLCVRPTSETLFCELYKNIVHSWRDLPKLYNQWCSVVRWEKTTRPFLRHREFLWQEGHTIHATGEEAIEETLRMLDVYAEFVEKFLAMPVIKGKKTEREKFAGAVSTYTIECMMHDGKALQSGTSHYFGTGFAEAFEITYADKDNAQRTPHQTSWGMSTRTIGGIIMTHGDDSGLVLPPDVAPVQVIVIPVASHKPGVIEAARELCGVLAAAGIRAKCDESEQSPGWKFSEHEMRGVPLRIELGPRDIEAGSCVAAARVGFGKESLPMAGIADTVKKKLRDIRNFMYDKALQNLNARTVDVFTIEEAREHGAKGFVRAMWCGEQSCEEQMKADAGLSSRCVPFAQERISESCVCCGAPAKHLAYWGVAY